jgi:hypothetical protein
MAAGTLSNSYIRSSPSPLKGLPTVVRNTARWALSAEDTLRDALVEVLELATAELRAAARADADWAKYEHLIEVVYEDGVFRYVLSGDQDEVDAALELEYGGFGTEPKSLIRKLARSQPASFARYIENSFIERLPRG